MDHDFTIEEVDGRHIGTCVCGYSAVGGTDEDVLENMAVHD